MHPALIAAIVVGVLAVAGKAFGGTLRRPPADADDPPEPLSLAAARWKPEAEAIGGPFPVGALLKVIKGESGFRQGIVVADKVTGASELGATQLVVEHASDGTPNAASRSGAIGADVDPLTMRGALWGAQWVYNKARENYRGDLEEIGMDVPPDSDVAIWTTIMHSQHSIGRGGFVRLMREAYAAGKRTVADALDYWINDKIPPTIGRMSGSLIRARLARMKRLPADGAAFAPLPTSIEPLPARPDGIPRFDAAKAKRYILAERRRGSKPRQADGSPPGV